MSDKIVGPLKTVPDRFGQDVPLYGLKYDKRGAALSPRTTDHLIAALQNDGITDLILYSHGWNNDFLVASERYETFLRGVSETNAAHPGRLPASFKPAFLGIVWPSTALVLPSEQAPDIAGGEFDPLFEVIDDDIRAELETKLASGAPMDEAALRALAEKLAPQLSLDGDAEEGGGTYTADDLMAAAKATAAVVPQSDHTGGGFDDFDAGSADNLDAAGLLDFDPRGVLRVFTVLQMKDRAGIVGGNGVAGTVRRILDESRVRLHLVGHSYGAKVVTTALVNAGASRKAHSALLLQPAINHLAFAPDIGDGTAGRFRPAFGMTEKPVAMTFSHNDRALHKLFHLAARRKSDVGEAQIAGSVSRFAALGGYGPQEFLSGEVAIMPIPASGTAYPALGSGVQILALDGKVGISGHGDVNSGFTYWAMLNQMHGG